MDTKNCSYCGKEFPKKISMSRKNWDEKIKYCSRSCYWKAKPKPPCICVVCGKEFKPTGASFSAVKYCSQDCFGISCRKPYPPCEVCGKPVRKHSNKYCSRKCFNLGYVGEKVYNYVGENFRKDASPLDYASWFKTASEIRARDIVCQHCGKTASENGRALDVHHIIPYRISKDNQPSNLVTLCRACHKRADAAIMTS